KKLLQQGRDRIAQLREGKPAWDKAKGLIARGYVSKIDGSVQPYGVLIPPTYDPSSPHKHRLDAWFHGRGETLSELNFVNGVQNSPGPFSPPDSIVLQLYGRYCCANKLAGEVDLLEALDDVKKHYLVDDNRIVIRGFSMGGAACWQFAVHFSSRWCAAAPGAGFSETADFLKVFQNDPVKPTAFEQTLWHMYDCTDYAVNLFNLPTVAYSGEIDKQKQAADMMALALQKEGMELTHIIGPKTAHAYEPKAKEEVARRIDAIVQKGRNPVPRQVKFTTWMLRYNEMFWLTVDGMEKEWERARVDAELVGTGGVKATTQNVNALTLFMPSGYCPLDDTRKPKVTLDDQSLEAPAVGTDRSWTAHFRKSDGKWAVVDKVDDGTLRKRHNLQGPIDDAFLDSFIMVRPSGTAKNDQVEAWVKKEMQHAIDHWRQQFRGDARVIDDEKVGDAEIAAHNLVLWGDEKSNKILARIAEKLPRLAIASETQVPLMIYPNPLNPKKYVVLNSGFTFREYDYLNNARQNPRLPDWAVVDVTTPPGSRWPGKVVDAGFFTEEWKLK
ncbi:MAG TPA: prolyl oligopeptidase family serine peptidase, partial [Planctomycetota bacterium]|nr:prolyl oligopeptidase family serine peptidase [Planctomycetota bacterium]